MALTESTITQNFHTEHEQALAELTLGVNPIADTVDPTVSDVEDIGTLWYNTVTDDIYFSKGAGVWTLVPSVARVEALEANIGLNTLRDMVSEGYTIMEMVDGFADEFEDSTAAGAVGGVYNSAGDYFNPAIAGGAELLVQSGGDANGSTTFVDTIGNHSPSAVGNAQHSTAQAKFGDSSIYSDGNTDSVFISSAPAFSPGTGDFTVDFWVYPEVLNANDVLFSMGASNIRSLSVVWTAANMGVYVNNSLVLFPAFAMTTGAWYHVVVQRISGSLELKIDGTHIAAVANAVSIPADDIAIGAYTNNANNSVQAYFEDFRYIPTAAIYDAAGSYIVPTEAIPSGGNMTLTSTTQTANSAPSHGRIVFLADPQEAITVNTDLIAEISSDGGTTWDTFTATKEADYDANIEIYATDEISITGGGTSMQARIRTLNDKIVRIHGWYVQWR